MEGYVTSDIWQMTGLSQMNFISAPYDKEEVSITCTICLWLFNPIISLIYITMVNMETISMQTMG